MNSVLPRSSYLVALALLVAGGCSKPPEQTAGADARPTAVPEVRVGMAAEDGWIPMFNGVNLDGWKSNGETLGSFTVTDGAIKTTNGRAHLFYIGPDGTASFKNFEFKARVKHMPGSNSGIYFHTEFQPTGWPARGYECQVNSTSHKDRKKTGGLYAVSDVLDKAPVNDDEWFDYYIRVEGKRIQIKINGETTVDWIEPEDWDPATALKNMPGRRLSEGTIALQAHDPDSTVYYKDLFIRPLP